MSNASCHSAGCQRARLTCPQNLFPAGSHFSRCPGSPHSSCPHPGSGTGSVAHDHRTASAVTHSGVLATLHRHAISAPHRSATVCCYLELQNPQCPLGPPGCLLPTHTLRVKPGSSALFLLGECDAEGWQLVDCRVWQTLRPVPGNHSQMDHACHWAVGTLQLAHSELAGDLCHMGRKFRIVLAFLATITQWSAGRSVRPWVYPLPTMVSTSL